MMNYTKEITAELKTWAKEDCDTAKENNIMSITDTRKGVIELHCNNGAYEVMKDGILYTGKMTEKAMIEYLVNNIYQVG